MSSRECDKCYLEQYFTKKFGGYEFCKEHLEPYVVFCFYCQKLKARHANATSEADEKLIDQARSKAMQAAWHASDKHINESCSNCDKPIQFEDWFCYCSLCPECYLQIPEDEIERMDEEFKQRATAYSHSHSE